METKDNYKPEFIIKHFDLEDAFDPNNWIKFNEKRGYRVEIVRVGNDHRDHHITTIGMRYTGIELGTRI